LFHFKPSGTIIAFGIFHKILALCNELKILLEVVGMRAVITLVLPIVLLGAFSCVLASDPNSKLKKCCAKLTSKGL
jgi:hypothetical protein